jgi:NAD(P)H-quinone oxidoreductase subunit 5
MSSREKTVGECIGEPEWSEPVVVRVLTSGVWLLWLASIAVAAVYVYPETTLSLGVEGIVAVDGLTVVMWSVVTFISGIVHSYSRRYMSGSRRMSGFFARIFAFTLVVMVLVASDSLALFGVAWLTMGLVMADLVGYSRGWKQAQKASRLARRYFVLSTAFLGVGLVSLWFGTGSTTVSGVLANHGAVSGPVYVVGVGALLGAAAVQSALVPFHGWLLSSMTAPTPASALMHAGFVNAGGVLLVRFSPVFTDSLVVMTAVVAVGAVGAVLGKLMKSVRPEIKSKLGCSTAGQMGFMVMQAGLGFFSAAVTHLILHGFYKAYLFLSSGDRVEHTSPGEDERASLGAGGIVAAVVVALLGGLLFAALTGKGAALDSGLVLVLLVVLTAAHATRDAVRTSLSPGVRFVAAPVVFLSAVAVYAGVFEAVTAVMEAAPAPTAAGLPLIAEPTQLTAVHVVVAVAFVAAYVAIEFGHIRRSDRLYVALLNASQPSSETVLTNKEEYNEY